MSVIIMRAFVISLFFHFLSLSLKKLIKSKTQHFYITAQKTGCGSHVLQVISWGTAAKCIHL